jgi:hypothetical protein
MVMVKIENLSEKQIAVGNSVIVKNYKNDLWELEILEFSPDNKCVKVKYISRYDDKVCTVWKYISSLAFVCILKNRKRK